MIDPIVRMPQPRCDSFSVGFARRSSWSLACLLLLAGLASCRGRARPAPRDACERAEGEWLGDDVESPNAAPEAMRVGRTVMQHEHWWISPRFFETEQSMGRTRERVQITERAPDRCTVELIREPRRRTMIWAFTADGRLRARAPNGLVTAILRRADPR